MNATNRILIAGSAAIISGSAAAQEIKAIGYAEPNPVNAGCSVMTMVRVHSRSDDFAAPYTVVEYFAPIGDVAGTLMNDEGLYGDQLEGDNIYSFAFELDPKVGLGEYSIPFEVSRDGTLLYKGEYTLTIGSPPCSPDFNGDGDARTDGDVEAFFACISGNCCPTCGSPDFNADGDAATDADIESFFRVLAGGAC